MAKVDYDKCFTVAVDLARKAGEMIRDAIKKKKNIQEKTSAVDLVTETDQAVEKLLYDGFKNAFPDHKFIGEESVSAGEKCELTDAPTWIIDPVDGTMNFVHSFPFTCVSIGFMVNKVAEIGVIYNPVLEQMFTARKGQGAFLNDERIHVSGETELSRALVFTETGSSRDAEKMKCVFHNFETLVPKVHGMRCMGSAALNMCQVASGYADVFFEYGIHVWDIAGGALVVREAGGVVVNIDGGPFDLMSRRVLCASSQALVDEISKLLRPYFPERD